MATTPEELVSTDLVQVHLDQQTRRRRLGSRLRPFLWISAGYALLYLTLWLVDRLGAIQMTSAAWAAGIGLAVAGQGLILSLAVRTQQRSRHWTRLGVGSAILAMLQFGTVTLLAPTAAPVLMVAWLVNLSHVASYLGRWIALSTAGVVTATLAAAGLATPEQTDTSHQAAILAIFVGAQLYTILSHASFFDRIWKREMQSRELIARAPVGLFRSNAAGRWSYANLRWRQMTGLTVDDALHDGWLSSLHPNDRVTVQRAWRRALKSGGDFEAEYRVRKPTGEESWLLSQASPVHDPHGQIREWVGSITDITDRVEAEEKAEQANRVKTDFLANMSHEIRTPIAGVVGASELLTKQDLPETARAYVEVISTSAASLLHLIDGLLDFSKIEAGKLAFEELDFSIVETIEAAVHMLRARALSKGIDLQCDLSPDVPADVHGDPLRVHQVLVNLLSNAIKFTQRGHVRLRVDRVRTAAPRPEPHWLLFEVEDTGIGIEASALDQLFEPFVQADSSTSRRFGGSGLGLSICKRIVDLMGGEIAVRSELGVGTTFTVRLPFAAAEELDDSTTEELPRRGVLLRRRSEFRILLAEDNPVNRMIAVAQLDDLGYRVTAVEHGKAVLEHLAEQDCDLVLMDCQMPELDGYETTRRIRQLGLGAAHLPIIAVTAHAVTGDRQRALDAGMNDYITKPYESRQLDKTISQWLWIDDRRS